MRPSGFRRDVDDDGRGVFDLGLPNNLVFAMHDGPWEFAKEAVAVFARIEHDRAVKRVRFADAHRSTFVRAVLSGAYSMEEIHQDVDLFNSDPRPNYHR